MLKRVMAWLDRKADAKVESIVSNWESSEASLDGESRQQVLPSARS